MPVASTDAVKVDGKPVSLDLEPARYVLLNKPPGVVSTVRDPQGRTTIHDLLTGIEERLYPVGRLDADSEGLLLCTNDGELANALTHPRHEVWKTYAVAVEGTPSPDTLDALNRGIVIDGRRTAPARFTLSRRNMSAGTSSLLKVQLREGRRRQIRRMLEAVGHSVLRLERMAIGPLRDASLPAGTWRDLTPREVTMLRKAAGLRS
jgi:23S rRNA pseudouridine2605 synthase